jgi:hypothetical protein
MRMLVATFTTGTVVPSAVNSGFAVKKDYYYHHLFTNHIYLPVLSAAGSHFKPTSISIENDSNL